MLNGKRSISREELFDIFESAKKVFFVGIGGVSMSALAEYCVYLGKEVYGYDRERNEACKRLETVAKKIKYCSTPDSASHMDLVVYSNAIDESNFEIQCAINEGLPLVSRSMLLGCIAKSFETGIGVSGMHGKSTVTSMLSSIFQEAGKEPTVFCGAVMRDIGATYRLGDRKTVIFESCEYMDSFLDLSPTDALILNIDYDHPDYFKSMNQIKKSFREFADRSGRVFINADNELCRSIFRGNEITFGINTPSEYTARNIFLGGVCEFDAYKNDKYLGRCLLNMAGIHSVYNALAAFCVSYENGICAEHIIKALSCFKGSERRLELYKKRTQGGDIYIDYAHHPKEISATLSAISLMGYKKILCVFQAHTYSRTYYLYKEFTCCFGAADKVIITDIYPAREENIYGVSEEILARDVGGEYISDLSVIANRIKTEDFDAAVIMGAGDITKIKKFL